MRRKSVFTINYISHDALSSILGEHGTVRCFDFVCVSLTLIHTLLLTHQPCESHVTRLFNSEKETPGNNFTLQSG